MNFYDQLIAKAQGKEVHAEIANHGMIAQFERKRRIRGVAATHEESLLLQAGARLLERRKQLGFSVNHMAVCLDVTGPCYRQWESRFGNLAQTKHLENVAKILIVDPCWISLGINPPTERINVGEGAREVRWRQTTPGLSIEERKELAKRAQRRRKELKLSPYRITMLMAMQDFTVKRMQKMEAYLPVIADVAVEARWEQVLHVPVGWIRNVLIDATPASELTLELNLTHASTIAEEIFGIGIWLSRAKFSTRTTSLEGLEENERRMAKIFSTRYGVNGESESTLQAIADSAGLTRQRIQQITSKMRERAIALGNSEPPLISRLRQEIAPLLPQTVANLDLHFRQLLGDSLSLAGVERFAQDVLERSVLTITENPANSQVPWKSVAIDPNTHDSHILRVIRDGVMAMVRNVGAAQVDFISGVSSRASGKGVIQSKVIEVIKMIPGFEWLQERDGWFWLGEKYENRLINVAKKVLAVAGRRVDIEDIHGAMARSRRLNYETAIVSRYAVEAPYAVLVSVLANTSWVELVQYDDFRLRDPIPLESVLSMVELAVYHLLFNRGGIASRFDIQKALLDVPEPAFTAIALHATLDSSPVFYRMDTGIFALRGVVLSAQALVVASASVGGPNSAKHQVSLSPDGQGFISLPITILSHMVNSGYFGIPRQLAKQLPLGDYKLEGVVEPITLSELPNGEYRLRKFTKHLVAAGLKVGDVITLSFKPQMQQFKWVRSS